MIFRATRFLPVLAALALCGVSVSAWAFSDVERHAMVEAAGLKYTDGNLVNECGNPVIPEFTTLKLRGSVGLAPTIQIGDGMCYGDTGSRIVIFKAEKGSFTPIMNDKASEVIVLKTDHEGVADIKLGVAGKQVPVWKWNGKAYEFWKNEPVKQDQLPK
jgi:hypothetical protein